MKWWQWQHAEMPGRPHRQLFLRHCVDDFHFAAAPIGETAAEIPENRFCSQTTPWKVLRLLLLLQRFSRMFLATNKVDSPRTVNRPITKANRLILLKQKLKLKTSKARVLSSVLTACYAGQSHSPTDQLRQDPAADVAGRGGSRMGTALTHQKVENLSKVRHFEPLRG